MANSTASQAFQGGFDLVSSLLGDLAQNKAMKWDQNARINVLNKLDAGNIYGLGRSQDIMDWLRNKLFENINRGDQQLYGNEDGSTSGLMTDLTASHQDLASKLPALFLSGGMDPAIQDAINNLKGNLGQRQPLMDSLSQILQAGGKGGNYDQIQGLLSQFANGQGSQMGVLSDVGQEILGNRGGTGFTGNVQDLASQILKNSGQTNDTDYMTKVAQNMVNAGGGNSVTDFLTSRGQQLASKNPLLDTDAAYSIARDQAATAASRQAENARREAYARGGGPGSIVGSGSQNNALNDFFDKALQNTSAAGQNALLGQQQLGLNQQGMGFGATEAGQSAATQRLLGTLGLLPQAASIAAGREANAGSLGLGATGAENARLNTGAGLLNSYTGNRMAALQQLTGLDQQTINSMLNTGSLFNTGVNNNNEALNQIITQITGGLNQNLSKAGAYAGAVGNNNQGIQAMIDSIFKNNQGTQGNMNDIAKQYMQYAATALSGLPNVFAGFQTTPINWGNLGSGFQNIVKAIGGGGAGGSGGGGGGAWSGGD